MSKLVNPAWMCFMERFRGSGSESLNNFGTIKSCIMLGQSVSGGGSWLSASEYSHLGEYSK